MERSASRSSAKSARERDGGSGPRSVVDELNSDDGQAKSHSHSAPASDLESRSSSEYHSTQNSLCSTSNRGRSHFPPTRVVHSRTIDHEYHHHHYDHHDSQADIPQRAWYEFDLAVMVALISPFGNWLTGGDHIKNFLFIALVVFYLHQVIEVPWMLYQKARRRKQPDHLPPVSSEDKYREIAISELRKFELFCLALTVISPFIGAYLLRYATRVILGPDFISWFSTGLFVMATGMRPWSHLIDRLGQRTTDLQNYIHYPPSHNRKSDDDVEESLTSLMKRIDDLEDSLAVVKSRLKLTSEDVLDYVDDAITSLKRSIRKSEKRWDEQEGRIRSVEQSIATLPGSGSSSRKKKSKLMMLPVVTATAASSIFGQVLPNWMLSAQRQSEKERSHYDPPKPLRAVPIDSASNGQLRKVLEANHPVLAKPSRLVAKILCVIGHVMLLPLRTVARIVFGR